jgi:hypothetical protein
MWSALCNSAGKQRSKGQGIDRHTDTEEDKWIEIHKDIQIGGQMDWDREQADRWLDRQAGRQETYEQTANFLLIALLIKELCGLSTRANYTDRATAAVGEVRNQINKRLQVKNYTF